MAESRVISVPTPLTEFYQVRVVESQELVSCERSELMDPDQTLGVDSAHLPSGLDSDDDEDPFSPTLPDWMRVGGKVTLLVNEKMYKGKLDLDDDKDWIFTVRGRSGQVPGVPSWHLLETSQNTVRSPSLPSALVRQLPRSPPRHGLQAMQTQPVHLHRRPS